MTFEDQIVAHMGTLLRITQNYTREIQYLVDEEAYPQTGPIEEGGQEIWEAVRLAGYTILGNGYFAVAVECPMDGFDNVAIKIGLKPEDSGAVYAAWARANPGPHVPEIHALQRYEKVWLCAMPKYYALPTVEYDEDGDETGNLISDAPNGVDIDGSYYTTELSHLLLGRLDYADLPDTLCETTLAIRAFFKDICTLDMYQDNLMQTADGTLVITDPVSFNRSHPWQ